MFTMHDILDLAIRLGKNGENDTILFYEMLKSFITDAETVKSLNRII